MTELILPGGDLIIFWLRVSSVEFGAHSLSPPPDIHLVTATFCQQN